MVNIQALAILGVLVALVPAASIAMPQDIPAEVKSCKAISDDKERLSCFDGLFGGPSNFRRKAGKGTPRRKAGELVNR